MGEEEERVTTPTSGPGRTFEMYRNSGKECGILLMRTLRVILLTHLNEHVAYKRRGPWAEVIFVTSNIDKIDKDGEFFHLSNRPF